MRFTKMEAVGNDFVVIDESDANGMDLSQLAVRLCRRHFGVGADGLLVIGRRSADAAIAPIASMRMFNPDGSQDMCGNGLRCAALWVSTRDWTEGRHAFRIATKDGDREAILSRLGAGRAVEIAVQMGTPRLTADAIPFDAPASSTVIAQPLDVAGRTVRVTSAYTGSTHTVIFGEQPSEDDFQALSPLIENHPLFPERTTVLWTTQTAEPGTFDVRIWERGVGETLGCGTGACAIAVAAGLNGLLSPGDDPLPAQADTAQSVLRTPIHAHIRSKGGTLHVAVKHHPTTGLDMQLLGPAEIVYEGYADI